MCHTSGQSKAVSCTFHRLQVTPLQTVHAAVCQQHNNRTSETHCKPATLAALSDSNFCFQGVSNPTCQTATGCLTVYAIRQQHSKHQHHPAMLTSIAVVGSKAQIQAVVEYVMFVPGQVARGSLAVYATSRQQRSQHPYYSAILSTIADQLQTWSIKLCH